MSKCSYCGKDAEISEHFHSESTSTLGKCCVSRIEWLKPEQFFFGEFYQANLYRLAKELLAERALSLEPEPLPEEPGTARDNAAHRNRFRSLLKAKPVDWMPIGVDPKSMHIGYGEDAYALMDYYDGTHRAMLARALGVPKIRAIIRMNLERKINQPKQYQTLIFKDSIYGGSRPDDRWKLLPRGYIEDRDILDLACNSGMNGIVNCVLSKYSTYCGFDKDKDAIDDGIEVAKSWGVSDRVKLSCVNLIGFKDWPKADVIFYFSCSKVVSPEILKEAIVASGARRVFLETHNIHDDPSSDAVLRWPLEWDYLGSTANVTDGLYGRRVFTARLR